MRDRDAANLHDTLVDEHVRVAERFSSQGLAQCRVLSANASQELRQGMPTLRAEDASRPPRPAPLPTVPISRTTAGRLPPPPRSAGRNQVIMLNASQTAEVFRIVRRRQLWRRAMTVGLFALTCCIVGAIVSAALHVLHTT